MKKEPALIISAIVGLLIAIVSQWVDSVEVLAALEVVLDWAVPLVVALLGGWLVRARVTPVK